MAQPLAILPVSPEPSATDAQLAADALELHRAMSELIRVVQFRDRDRICCHDVSVSQCYALETLVLRGPMPLNELAAYLYLDKSTASRVVKGLVGKGYVERRPHPEDGRSMILAPSAAGRALHGRIDAELCTEVERLVADFDPEVRQAMSRLLARLGRAATSAVERVGAGCCIP